MTHSRKRAPRRTKAKTKTTQIQILIDIEHEGCDAQDVLECVDAALDAGALQDNITVQDSERRIFVTNVSAVIQSCSSG